MSQRIAAAQRKLVSLNRMVLGLEKRVAALAAATPVQSKQIPAFFTTSFTFEWGDMQTREQTIVNGAEDAKLYGFTYHVSRFTAEELERGLADTPAGLVDQDLVISNTVPMSKFDFAWDWRIARDQQRYLNPLNSYFPLSRQSLGRRETQRHLFFELRPQEFEAGGALTVSVRPLAYASVLNTDQILVQIIAYGIRDGVLATGEMGELL